MIAKNMISKEGIVQFNIQDTLSSFIGKMSKNDAKDGYALEEGKFAGVFSPMTLFRSKIDVTHTKVSHFLKDVHKLTGEDDVIEIARQMVLNDTMILPVFDKDGFLGVVSAYDVLERIDDFPVLKQKKIDDFLRQVALFKEDESMTYVLNKMHENKEREVPVVDKHGYLSGILGHSDVLLNYYIHDQKTDYHQSPNNHATRAYDSEPGRITVLPVKDFMRDFEALKIESLETLYDAAGKMLQNRSQLLIDEDSMKIIDLKAILKTIGGADTKEFLNIHYQGMDKVQIEDHTKQRLFDVTRNYVERMQKKLGHVVELVLHLKDFERGGKNHRFEIQTRMTAPGEMFTAESDDWDAVRAVRKTLDTIESQISHKLSVQKQSRPGYRASVKQQF